MTPRSAGRIVLAGIGGVALLAGAVAVGVGALLTTDLDGKDSLRTEADRIEVQGCSTVIMEIAGARVDAGQLERFEPISDRSQPLLNVRPFGTSGGPWLIGSADQEAVEQQLLGARYCLVEVAQGAWSSTAVVPQMDSPDPEFSGVAGLWATASSGEAVALPLPEPGSSVVVSGSSDSSLTALEVVGELEIAGAGNFGLITLIGGVMTALLGVLMVLISIFGLRTKGRHEGSTLSVGKS